MCDFRPALVSLGLLSACLMCTALPSAWAQAPAGPVVLENDLLRITLDAATGAVVGLTNKATNTECLAPPADPKPPFVVDMYSANQAVYVRDPFEEQGGGFSRYNPALSGNVRGDLSHVRDPGPRLRPRHQARNRQNPGRRGHLPRAGRDRGHLHPHGHQGLAAHRLAHSRGEPGRRSPRPGPPRSPRGLPRARRRTHRREARGQLPRPALRAGRADSRPFRLRLPAPQAHYAHLRPDLPRLGLDVVARPVRPRRRRVPRQPRPLLPADGPGDLAPPRGGDHDPRHADPGLPAAGAEVGLPAVHRRRPRRRLALGGGSSLPRVGAGAPPRLHRPGLAADRGRRLVRHRRSDETLQRLPRHVPGRPVAGPQLPADLVGDDRERRAGEGAQVVLLLPVA